ncbi:hypothetical protein [Ruminococcus flavefaciens]|uniref:hypothetical protein n=1 Tax=Ruminococcus flavefaciens TaxID=1265 RepID=UPI000683DCC5|nr:hypothetical protein [Ruminococcus flavefaciens]
MEKLDFSGVLDFNDVDLTDPNIVVQGILSQIKDATGNIITGNIEPYSGHIFPSNNLSLAIGTVDIQKALGKQGEEKNKYEVYLSTPVFDQYKYRICFIQFGVAKYPVTVVLEKSIATELKKIMLGSDYIFKCDNRTELEELMYSVIKSEKVIEVMQELIKVYQIHRKDIE